MRILIVGSGAREHALCKTLSRSASKPLLFCCATNQNPGIKQLTQHYWQGNITCVRTLIKLASQWKINLAIIGPEAPLEMGLVDALEEEGIATVGPKKALAQIETSKRFTRNLLKKYHIPGSPEFRSFNELTGVLNFLHELGHGRYVIKADGLMSGKGVKVAGEHLHSFEEAYHYCNTLLRLGQSVVIEEKLIGQEFSYLSFCDGERLIPMPLVQDHKRAFVNDQGPNTGGMGSYSDANHSLPFLRPDDVTAAEAINNAVIQALKEECGEKYRGILYGSFMVCRDGVKLIEYNARFGDPEAINILSILDSDLVDVCQSLVQGHLDPKQVRFKPLATVCKYAVPLGYPEDTVQHKKVDVTKVQNKDNLYFAAIDDIDGDLYVNKSRALAVVGSAPTIAEAESIAEKEIKRIEGPLFHREDIGTSALINKRIQMMQALYQEVYTSC